MEKLKALVAYLVSAAGLNEEQVSAYVDAGSISLRGRDQGYAYLSNGEKVPQLEIGLLRYDGIILIEGYAGSGPLLLALIVAWLAANDPDRERDGLADPAFDVDLNDPHSSDFELAIEFEERLTVRADPAGPIEHNGEKWSLAPLQITPAEEIAAFEAGLTYA